jgi:segregation and condensation protein B
MTDPSEMEAALEAVLFVAAEPVERSKLLEIFGSQDREEAGAALERVTERYRGRPASGVQIEEVAGGLRLVTRPELHGYLRKFFEVSGRTRLSMAALETLAIVAYRQPITGPEIQELRGVSPAGVLKTLLERRLVRIAGRKKIVGKPFLYRTTREFLMHFGLESLEDLPPLEEFEEVFGSDDAGLGSQAAEFREPAVAEPGTSAEAAGSEES